MPGLSQFLMEEVEVPLIPVVADMENAGYPVDAEFFGDLRDLLEPERAATATRLGAIAGREFNPNSSQQVAWLLYEHLGLPVLQRTAGGQPATNKNVLKKIDHEAARLLLRHRQLAKVLGTYCSIPEKLGPDGRFHVKFDQLGAETGRFTSQSVIQTIPKLDEFRLRNGFRAEPGMLIVAADFDQQELRILAGVSGDQNMRGAIDAGTDLHGLAAVKMFGLDCDPNEVAEEYPDKRQQVKALQFGLIYGRSAASLAEALAISLEEAQKLQKAYFAQFPAVQQFVEEAHRRVVRDGFITDLFGRVRHLPNAKCRRPHKHYGCMTAAEKKIVSKINAAKREAQNFLVQGPAATITKLAMLACHQHLQAEHPAIKMILQVHDELHFKVPEGELDHFAEELPGLMSRLDLERFDFHVPMSVAVKVGPSWGELASRTIGTNSHVESTDATAPI